LFGAIMQAAGRDSMRIPCCRRNPKPAAPGKLPAGAGFCGCAALFCCQTSGLRFRNPATGISLHKYTSRQMLETGHFSMKKQAQESLAGFLFNFQEAIETSGASRIFLLETN
jgi:hypothetical protein